MDGGGDGSKPDGEVARKDDTMTRGATASFENVPYHLPHNRRSYRLRLPKGRVTRSHRKNGVVAAVVVGEVRFFLEPDV